MLGRPDFPFIKQEWLKLAFKLCVEFDDEAATLANFTNLIVEALQRQPAWADEIGSTILRIGHYSLASPLSAIWPILQTVLANAQQSVSVRKE